MKLIKTIVLGAMLAMGMTGTIQAASSTIYIAGSSAYRAQTHAAIMHLLGSANYNVSTGVGSVPSGNTSDSTPLAFGYAYSGSASNLGGANNAIFIGNVAGIGNVIIHTSWTGSETGLYAITLDNGTGANVSFIADTATTSTNGTNNTAPSVNHVPDAALSDTFQSNSQWFAGASYTLTDGSVHTFADLAGHEATTGTLPAIQGIVGVTYFGFGVSKSGKDDGITNITAEQAKYLYKQGNMPVTMLMPAYSGTGAKIYAVGRDPDAGTRLTAFGEIGLGLLSNTVQYYPFDSTNAVVSASGVAISYIKPVPSSVVNQITVSTGNGGYNSGDTLAKAINNEAGDQSITSPFKLTSSGGTAQPIGSCLLTYATIADLNNLTNGLKLTFNGVAATDANVQNGTYPLWSYEHMYFRPSADTTVGNAIATQILAEPAGVGCVPRASMKVQRLSGSKDGGAMIQPGTL